jgi:hypothetical protein
VLFLFVGLVFWSSVWTVGLTECLFVKIVSVLMRWTLAFKTKSINMQLKITCVVCVLFYFSGFAECRHYGLITVWSHYLTVGDVLAVCLWWEDDKLVKTILRKYPFSYFFVILISVDYLKRELFLIILNLAFALFSEVIFVYFTRLWNIYRQLLRCDF